MHRRLLVCVLALLTSAVASSLRAAPPAPHDPYDRSNVPIEEQPADPTAAKIVLIAGDAGTGHGPGEHEHFAGCALFYRMLKQTPGVAPVMVANGWPSKPDTLANARAVVFYMDGAGKQTTVAHADEIDRLAAAGVGIVHVHQCIDYPADFVPHAVRWLGAAYHPKTGLRAHWDATYDAFVDHPTTRGVEPFKLVNEGFIYKLTWVDGMAGVTPLLRAKNPKEKPGAKVSDADQVFCWAYERPDGGRSFVNTGGHLHANWGQAGFRRLMINGILWAAKVEVPSAGAKVELDPADLVQDMERKAPAVSKPRTPNRRQPAESK
jgi:type 1 glutamine amidotransferase